MGWGTSSAPRAPWGLHTRLGVFCVCLIWGPPWWEGSLGTQSLPALGQWAEPGLQGEVVQAGGVCVC